MAEVAIGLGKSAQHAYGFDDVAIVPSRRTRDAEDVDLSWELEAMRFDLPFMGAPMDGISSPATAAAIGRMGGIGVLDLEGIWTRYEDPEPLLAEIAGLDPDKATRRLQEIYAEPVVPTLVTERIRQLRADGAMAAGAVTPQRADLLLPAINEGEIDLLVIHGTVVSAEHVTRTREDPLNLLQVIRRIDAPVVVGGCASYQAALHLMRTGAVGVLVGVGTGSSCTTADVLGVSVPQATAVADARGARMRHLDETGVYCHVIADGGIATSGQIAKAVACGADAVMLGSPLAAAAEAPGRGLHWGHQAAHPTLPRGNPIGVPTLGTLEEVLLGPAVDGSGRTNLFGGLRAAMATTGHKTVKELQKADLVVTSGPGSRA